MEKDSGLRVETYYSVSCDYINWKWMTKVLSDIKVSIKMKGVLYKRVVKLALTYDAKTSTISKLQPKGCGDENFTLDV